jgi:hypothetical protein
MNFFSKLIRGKAVATPLERFWIWFETNSERLWNIPDDVGDRKLFDELSSELRRAAPGLTWELSRAQNGKREFVISADGQRERFPLVKRIVAAAPTLERWVITAFRPRDPIGNRIVMGEVQLNPDDIWFGSKLGAGGSVELIFAVRGLTEDNFNQLMPAVIILMDGAIGEYDAVMKVRNVYPAALPPDPGAAGLRPFKDLPSFIDTVPYP